MKSLKKLLPLLFLILGLAQSLPSSATELSPWLGNFFEFELRSHFRYEEFNHLDTQESTIPYHAHNRYYGMSLAFTPWPDRNAEIEVDAARTKKNEFNFECARLTGRKQWLDDISGDFISLVTGTTFIVPGRCFLKDLSVTYHSNLNIELSLALGKEWTFCCPDWLVRLWGYGGYGFANQGNPWTHEKIMLEGNFFSKHQVGVFSEGLFGLGHNRLNPLDFDGYKGIRHQAVDVGGSYRYVFDYLGAFCLDYYYRVYARNCPEEVHSIKATLLLTFGL